MNTVLKSNSFFSPSLDREAINLRILELEKGKVGLYSVGLYPASLAYNCAMQKIALGTSYWLRDQVGTCLARSQMM